MDQQSQLRRNQLRVSNPIARRKVRKKDEKSNVLPRQQRRQNACELSKAKLQSDLQSTSSKTKLSTEAAYRTSLDMEMRS